MWDKHIVPNSLKSFVLCLCIFMAPVLANSTMYYLHAAHTVYYHVHKLNWVYSKMEAHQHLTFSTVAVAILLHRWACWHGNTWPQNGCQVWLTVPSAQRLHPVKANTHTNMPSCSKPTVSLPLCGFGQGHIYCAYTLFVYTSTYHEYIWVWLRRSFFNMRANMILNPEVSTLSMMIHCVFWCLLTLGDWFKVLIAADHPLRMSLQKPVW